MNSSVCISNVQRGHRPIPQTWLKDGRGRAITWRDVPTNVSGFVDNDPYRDIAEWVRDNFGFIKCKTTDATESFPQCKPPPEQSFIEFRWADYMRRNLPIEGIYDMSIQDQAAALVPQLDAAISLVQQPDAKYIVGWNQDPSTQKPDAPVEVSSTGCEM